jgi:hypothetical protein
MQKNIILVIVCLIFVISTPNRLSAQSDASGPTVYMQIQYLEVLHPSTILDVMSETLLPFQQKRVLADDILDWALYETLISGPNDRYGLISITKTYHYDELFREFSLSEKFHEVSDANSMMTPQVFLESIRVIRSEIWILEGDALSPGAELPKGSYITKNFLDTRGASGEHRTMELDFWRPIHHKRIENGILNAWAMYNLSKPGGSTRNYTYSTIDYYESLGDVAGFNSREMARQAHPSFSEEQLSDYFNRTGPSRTAYKTELWRNILQTE